MSKPGPSPKQLSDPEFLLCCINSISNGGIDYAAVAKAANYANDGRARARLSRINSKHGTGPLVSEGEEKEDRAKKTTKDTVLPIAADSSTNARDLTANTAPMKGRTAESTRIITDSTNPDSAARVTRSSAAKVPASGDLKGKKKKRASSA
ncbi:hypothetical protein TWF718_011149 [Orbilia javanica]|uniref:Myb-like DNA-binding domain-containing protein n=1 Tax=Orbilia javanica TaxID=47235 RepID=A0AAN8MGW6_9PEZI